MRILICCLFLIGQLQAQNFQWKEEIANPLADRTYLNDIDFDSQGNVYVVGAYQIGYQDPEDPHPLSDGAFIQKYTPAGQLLWSDTIKGGFHTSYNNLAIDHADNIWVVGTSNTDNGQVVINGNPVSYSEFRVGYNTAGQVQAVVNFTGKGDLVFDHTENVFYYATGSSVMGLQKFDSNWNPLWALSFGNSAPVRLRIAQGAITMAGGSTHMSMPCQFAKVTSAGQLLWVKDVWNGSFQDMALDDSANIYLGMITEIHKFDAQGNFMSAYQADTSGGGYGLEFYNGHLFSNNGAPLGSKNINTVCFNQPYNLLWSEKFAFSDCCIKPRKITVDHNSLYGIGNFGQYSTGFVYKLSLPPATGIPQHPADKVKIYPNPTQGILYIPGTNEIQVYDLSGKTVFARKPDPAGGAIDLSFLPAGVYSYHLPGQTVNNKLVIIK